MKKIVGITHGGDVTEGRYRINTNYAERIVGAGAIPIVLTPVSNAEDIEKLLDVCDGIVLSGGPDVSPAEYGEEKIAECGYVSEERDSFELALVRAAIKRDMPVLAICRGAQVLNVAFGGSLWQDIPSQIDGVGKHSSAEKDFNTMHEVTVVDERIFDLVPFAKKEFEVNSYHHQAVKRVADSLSIMAVCKNDGVVEGIFAPNSRFVVGLQWHPEKLDAEDENSKMMFRSFVDAL